jgi:dihydroorotate dehydrogenase (fumarate)
MVDLTCNYLGLELKNPIIVGSSGLTSSVDHIKSIIAHEPGAIVLKSIFEEQIKFETTAMLDSDNSDMKTWQDAFNDIVNKHEFYHDEAYQYMTDYAQEHTLKQYLSLISEAKKITDIPIIASINCVTQYDWSYFAKRIQEAGADAIELNVYLLPSDFNTSGEKYEQVYLDVVEHVKAHVTIPISLKIGCYFSNLSGFIQKLSKSGIAGLTLFNRPYNPDIDIDTLQLSATNMFSNQFEYSNTLRWVALLSGKIDCDIAASTGIHDYQAVIKQLLAGADAVQMVSVFYENKKNFGIISEMKTQIETWMEAHDFNSIKDFKGLLSQYQAQNPSSYERVQFIRLYSGVI